ncbi:hypothetical protein [Rheinheimera sediminis]|uniref:hypothetical protein n=1 Tax=Rheinheimera sp. YQF-1 TaxID=2499626 RepID=UPI001646C2F2|nr:hypothetical protein [Rheinheimera sp. YQF-1]
MAEMNGYIQGLQWEAAVFKVLNQTHIPYLENPNRGCRLSKEINQELCIYFSCQPDSESKLRIGGKIILIMADFVHFSAEAALTAVTYSSYAHLNTKAFCLPGTTHKEYLYEEAIAETLARRCCIYAGKQHGFCRSFRAK